MDIDEQRKNEQLIKTHLYIIGISAHEALELFFFKFVLKMNRNVLAKALSKNDKCTIAKKCILIRNDRDDKMCEMDNN